MFDEIASNSPSKSTPPVKTTKLPAIVLTDPEPAPAQRPTTAPPEKKPEFPGLAIGMDMGSDETECDEPTAAAAGLAALPAVAVAILPRNEGERAQANVIALWLASLSTADAFPVALNRLSLVDDRLQPLLLAVVAGAGRGEFTREKIRETVIQYTGVAGVTRLDYCKYSAALDRLVHRAVNWNRTNGDFGVRIALSSLCVSRPGVPVGLDWFDRIPMEAAVDFTFLLSALFGAKRGTLTITDVRAACERGGLKIRPSNPAAPK